MIAILITTTVLSHLGTYNGTNAGIYIEIGNNSYGYEYRGEPGFFQCLDDNGDFYC